MPGSTGGGWKRNATASPRQSPTQPSSCAALPEPGSARTLAAATLANTIGTGIWLSGSALFFTRSAGLSATEVGVGISTAGVFGLAAAIRLGHLADRRGPRGVAVVLLLLSAVATCGYGLVHSFAVFVVLVSIDAVAQAGGLAARGALIAATFSSRERVRTLAYLRAVSNLGISLGTVAAGVALRADTRAAYLALVFGNAASYLIAAGGFLALPSVAPATRAVGSGITGALRDLPFVTVTILNGALSVQYVLLDIAMPLWVVRYTHAPAWSVAPLFLINTMVIIMLQVRTSRGTEQLPAARRAVQRSGWAFAVGALTFAAAHWTPDGLVAAVLAAAVVAHTVGELWPAGATFGISFELAPASAQGQYQGLFSMGMGLARTIGPAFVTLLTITWGPPGWICVAAYFVLASRALSIAIRWAERRRPRLLSCAAPSRSDVHRLMKTTRNVRVIMGETRCLLLWDVDQTLIEAGIVTKRAYARAFQDATGMPLRQPWEFDGRTELAAVTQVLRDHGIVPAAAVVDLFITRIVHELHERADELTHDGGVLPGAAEALRACAALPGVHQSVLTGNVYQLAVLKLKLFRLAEYLDLRIGAFGDDAHDRSDLVAHAWRRAEEHLGQRFTGHDTIIVGDTLRDIATARRAGARVVAVATGPYQAAQLRGAGADCVLADLADTAAVLRAIFGA